jgi:hypothetical protein
MLAVQDPLTLGQIQTFRIKQKRESVPRVRRVAQWTGPLYHERFWLLVKWPAMAVEILWVLETEGWDICVHVSPRHQVFCRTKRNASFEWQELLDLKESEDEGSGKRDWRIHSDAWLDFPRESSVHQKPNEL